MPENVEQISLFGSSIQIVQAPNNKNKDWEMRQDFISQKFTTSWDEIPKVFV